MNLTEKRKEERNRIIETSREVFKKYGCRKATMNDIAYASGKAKSSVYYYFKSKDEVCNAVIFTEAGKYRNTVLKAVSEIKNPEKQLKAYILIRLQTDKVYSNFYNSMNHFSKKSKFVKRLKKIYDDEEFRIFSNILKSGIEAGYFDVYDIKYAAVGIVTAMRGLETVLLHQFENPEIEKKIDNILKIILYGIVKR
ncbi:MAG: TetR/AcrR family transcriptional regulator [Chlorobi bacterium]|nr:TetR/AcrR family transcriptional regulator [Chlorobiota bacterium]